MRVPTVVTALGLTTAGILAATVPAAAATSLPDRPPVGTHAAAEAPGQATAAPTPPGQEQLGGVLGSLLNLVTGLLGGLVGPVAQDPGTKDLTNNGVTEGRQAPLTPLTTLSDVGGSRP
ncbi:hypothetical protein [Streptomyces sp. NRRL S-920]|uniref:hypothetical protein n=1 Tax=Streptomyces sp. NRRL S-920 TaxID=1463921 RepID=UPI0004CBC27F|nr:hypothetical protein [Streptomyces sp. NRRL S-920]